MNYPFDPQNISSDNSRNQFMMQDSSMSIHSNLPSNGLPQDMEKIFSYMKNVMSNPLLMDQMEKFLSAKETEKNSSFINTYDDSLSMSKMQNQMKNPPESYLIEPSNSYRPQPLKMGPSQNIKKVKSLEINPAIKKGSNRPSPQLQKQIYQNERHIEASYQQMNNLSNQYEERHKQKEGVKQQKNMRHFAKQAVSFQDMPIKSNYIENQQFNNLEAGSGTLAQYPQSQSQYFKNPSITKPKKSTTVKVTQTNKMPNNYNQFEERPISGTNKDFKQLLRQKGIESPFDQKPLPTLVKKSENRIPNLNQYEEPQNHDQQKPKRQFLKRGTRQYLSSAKDKKSSAKITQQNKNKEIQQNLNNSRFAIDKDKDKTPTKRDVSQNRILSKRNTNNNDKSLTKLKPNQDLNNSYQESSYQQKQDTTKRNITPKNQRSAVQSKSPILLPKSNKLQNNTTNINKSNLLNPGSGKKKNVFDDSSSSDQDQQNSQNHQQYESLRTNNLMDNKSLRNQTDKKNFNSYQPDQQYNMFSRQKKQQVIQGVFLTKNQLQNILQKYAPKSTVSSKNLNSSEEKFNQLRKKYTDLCKLVEKQKIEHEQQMEKDREEFQSFRQQEMQKIKNERRVMERQVKSSMPSQSQNLQKDKEQIQNLRKQLQKQKQEHKKKEKNNKILIDKYKKENQELKFRIQKLEEELQNKNSVSSLQNNFSSASERQTNSNTGNSRSSLMNDKSKSKSTTKDVSPAKGKINKTSKNLLQKQQQDMISEKNYKKTVPLYKAKDQKNQKSPAINQKKNLNNYDENSNSDDENLPTFKVENKNRDQIKTKTQKKYQFVENSVESNKINKKQNQSSHVRKSSNHQSKASSKNVFADDSEEQNFPNDLSQNQEQFGNSEDEGTGFLKKQPTFQNLNDLINKNFSIKCVNPQLIENLFRYQNNVQYKKYLSRVNNPKRIIVNSSKNGVDKKITNIYSDKSKQILFQNGVKKQIFQDGYTIIYFKNGDLKQKLTDGTILYYFKEKQVDQITLINGLNIYRFQNNQVELHFDGGKYIEISHPDGTIKILGSPVH